MKTPPPTFNVPNLPVPVISIEPVVCESVVTIVSTLGDPSFFSKYILPSAVFIPNSPSCKSEVVGVFPATEDRFNLIT